MLECDYCGVPFEPTATRWLCPSCHMKASCCEGAPLPAAGAAAGGSCPAMSAGSGSNTR